VYTDAVHNPDKTILMKWIAATLLLIFLALQYRLWVGDGSVADMVRLDRELQRQNAANERLQERNRILAIEVEDLKEGLNSVEERAREDMGMIKEGETFYMLIEANP
jgi:cell division protein FtsB